MMKKAHKLFENITIVVDTREQCPYRFGHDAVRAGLPTGDYSLLGFEDKVAIERKTVDDLVGCLKGAGRERFERELQRSRSMDYFALVIEGSLSGLAQGHYQSHMSPASVVQSILALSIRYRVPLWFAESRQMGQRITESLLEKYARDVCKRFAVLQGVIKKEEAA
ncbi:ERCC4 domain-containing protein [Thermodesulfobacteriota bacterium]